MVEFHPRDIGMWRGRNGSIKTYVFSSFEDFFDWLEVESPVRTDDATNPVSLTYETTHNRFVVKQWTVVGWLKIVKKRPKKKWLGMFSY